MADADPWAAFRAPPQQPAAADADPWAAFRTRPAAPSVAADIAGGIQGGIIQGATGAPGAPQFVADKAKEGGDFLARQTVGRVYNRFAPGGTGDWSADERQVPEPDVTRFSPENVLPTPQWWTGQAEKVIGPTYRPQTGPGQIANTVGQFLGSGVGPLGAAAGTTLSEGGGALTHGTAFEEPARMIGAMVGPAGVQALRGARTSGQALMAEAAQGATPAELAATRGRMAQGQEVGVPLTVGEALNAETGGRFPRVSQLERVAGQSGGQALTDLYAARPDQVQSAAAQGFHALAPSPVPADRAAQAGQNAAAGALQDLRNRRANATEPFYTAAHNDVVPEPFVREAVAQIDNLIQSNPNPEIVAGARDLRQRLVEQAGQPGTPGTPATRTPVMGPDGRVIRYETTPGAAPTPATPEGFRTNAGDLNEVTKAIRDTYAPPGPVQIGSSPTERAAIGVTRDALAPVNEAAVNASPSLAQARDLHGRISERMVQPAEQGPLGKIAETDPGGVGASQSMGGSLLGVGEGDRYHQVVQQAARRLVRQDPQAAATIARDYLAGEFQNATAGLRPGADQYGGAGFRASLEPILGNARAMVTQLPNGQQRWAGFQRLLDVFEATGYKPVKGSDTAFNTEVIARMKNGADLPSAAASAATGAVAGGAAGGVLGSAGGAAVSLKRTLSERWTRYRMGNNVQELAHLLTDPASVGLLGQLGRTPANSAKAQALTLRLSRLAEIGAQEAR